MKKISFYFFALAATGNGISGGDRIFIELARNWSKHNIVTIYTSPDGIKMCDHQRLGNSNINLIAKSAKWLEKYVLVEYLYKILLAFYLGFTLKIDNQNRSHIYSASEFWMDTIPAIILKLRYRKIRWTAAWYQTAPNPLKGFAEAARKERYRSSALYMWLVQLLIKPFIDKFADIIIVNNESERKAFSARQPSSIIVLIGAVRLDEIKQYNSSHLVKNKKYDAVFQGRFHPQKGVVELIKIWKFVVRTLPNAQLAMIGDGPLMRAVKREVIRNKLMSNVTLFGYVFDGEKKYNIFAKSKLVVHPAFFDSGGMASAEAMAFAIPCVGFDLKSYQSYYPRGMVKVEIGNLELFALEVIKLLKDDTKRNRIGSQALKMIQHNWSWDKRSEDIYRLIIK